MGRRDLGLIDNALASETIGNDAAEFIADLRKQETESWMRFNARNLEREFSYLLTSAEVANSEAIQP